MRWKWKEGESKRYDLRSYYDSVTKQDIKYIHFIKHKVTGLTFNPMWGELCYDLDELDSHVVVFYKSCKTSRVTLQSLTKVDIWTEIF